jgi:hypothetical protein
MSFRVGVFIEAATRHTNTGKPLRRPGPHTVRSVDAPGNGASTRAECGKARKESRPGVRRKTSACKNTTDRTPSG